MVMLNPEVPMETRNNAKTTRSISRGEGSFSVKNHVTNVVVASKGAIYTIPLTPPESTLPKASSRLEKGRLNR